MWVGSYLDLKISSLHNGLQMAQVIKIHLFYSIFSLDTNKTTRRLNYGLQNLHKCKIQLSKETILQIKEINKTPLIWIVN
jgi:hypothetical protein